MNFSSWGIYYDVPEEIWRNMQIRLISRKNMHRLQGRRQTLF
ncbi:hypothetical protein [Caldivirga sp. UBA161]|nr:hypothetical protein [Caldivirga sp. UBA161]